MLEARTLHLRPRSRALLPAPSTKETYHARQLSTFHPLTVCLYPHLQRVAVPCWGLFKEAQCRAGKQLFQEAMGHGHMNGFFKLMPQFTTQAEPAFCGLTSLCMVMNALEVRPQLALEAPCATVLAIHSATHDRI